MSPSRKLNQVKEPTGSGGSGLIYGIAPVIEALRAGGRSLDRIIVADGRPHKRVAEIKELAREQNVPFRIVPRNVIVKTLGADVNHQGVAAYRQPAVYADADELVETVSRAESALCLILDGIEDPHNLGAIIRTAECAGVDGVFIPERRAAGLNETVAKTSSGAVEFVDVARVTNINKLIDRLKEHGFWIIGACGTADKSHTTWDWNQKCALVMGSEGSGLHRLTAEKCDVLVKIPMYGRIDSLNVSVAAGVLLFEARRQRGDKHRTDQKEE